MRHEGSAAPSLPIPSGPMQTWPRLGQCVPRGTLLADRPCAEPRHAWISWFRRYSAAQ